MEQLFDMPPQITAETLGELYSYLQRMADRLNEMGNYTGGGLTDNEMRQLSAIVGNNEVTSAYDKAVQEYISLKSLIIKTATWVKSTMEEMRTTLKGKFLSKSNLGTYSKDTKMDVVMDSEGVKHTFTLNEMLQGENSFNITAKGYIKQGKISGEGTVPPVYGIAIGKELVEFSENGQVLYHEEKKVATFTADEVAFWTQSDDPESEQAVKLASYTGEGITLYVNGNKAAEYTRNGMRLYQQNGTAGAYTMQVLDDASFGIRYEPVQ